VSFWENYSQELRQELQYVAPGPVRPWTNTYSAASHAESRISFLGLPDSEQVPDHAWEPSSVRPGATKAWDRILTQGRLVDEPYQNPREPRDLKTLPRTSERNLSAWYSTYQRHHAGAVDPWLIGPTSFEGGSAAWSHMINVAHAMTHIRRDRVYRKEDYWSQYMCNTYDFLQDFVSLVVAKFLQLPFRWPHGTKEPLPYGIRVVPTLRLEYSDGKCPILQELWDDRLVTDTRLLYVCAAVTVGADPLTMREGFGNEPADWWSFLPISVQLHGWETVTRLLHQPLYYRERLGFPADKRKAAFTMHAADLQPMATLIPAMNEVSLPEVSEKFYPIDEFLATRYAVEAAGHSPPWPCYNCLTLNGYHTRALHPARGADPMNKEEADEHRGALKRGYAAIRKARIAAGETQQERATQKERYLDQKKLLKPKNPRWKDVR